jgi:uncharacterized repeat protein (TIGR02543 family)
MRFEIHAISSNDKLPTGFWTAGSCPVWFSPSSFGGSRYDKDAGSYFRDFHNYYVDQYIKLNGFTHNNLDFVYNGGSTSVSDHYVAYVTTGFANVDYQSITNPQFYFRVRIKSGWNLDSVTLSGCSSKLVSSTAISTASTYTEYEIRFSTQGEYMMGMQTDEVFCNLNISPVKYTVTFNKNYSGSSSTSSTGTSVTLPSPTRTGYTLSGWYTAASGGTKVGDGGASYTPTANITLYAHWEAISYTIAFNGNGYTSGSTASISAKYGTKYTLTSNGFSNSNGKKVSFNGNGGSAPSTITSTLYFNNWNTKADGTGTSYSDMASVKNLRSDAGNVTLYAQWKSNAISLPSSTRVGYTLNGWYTAASGGTKVGGSGGSYTPTADITLYAQWTQQTYTITFNSNGGSTPNPSTKGVTYGSTYGTLPTVTRTGYTFAGWYTATSGGNKIESSTKVTITSAQTLYARWTANKYTVSFNANGGSVSSTSKTVTYNSDYGTLPTPTRAQYNFVGWYTASSGGTQVTATTTVSTASNHTLYARWAIGKYTVKFDGNGATSGTMSNQTFTFGVAQRLSANTYVKHDSTYNFDYDFLGWSKSSSATTATYVDNQSVENIASSVDETVTLYAVWRKKTLVTVRSDNPNLGTVNNVTGYYSVGAKVTLVATIKDSTEIKFLGWYLGDTKQSGSASYEIIVGASDVTYVAKFRSVVHYLTVTYPSVGGDVTVIVSDKEIEIPTSGSTKIKVLEGESVQLRATPDYNYDANVWRITDNGGIGTDYESDECTFVVNENSDVNIYATHIFKEKPKFSITVNKTGRGRGAGTIKITDSYGHTFVENKNGSIIELLYVGLQYQVQASIDPTASHVRFNGWYSNDSAVGTNDVYTILQNNPDTATNAISLSADFKSSLHTLNISSTEPNYSHIEARIGETLLEDLTNVTVTDGQKVSIKVVVSNLCLLDEWTVDSTSLPDKKNDITVDIVESMGDVVSVVAHIDKRAQSTFRASKVGGEYGTISVSYDDVINTDNGTLGDNTVTFTEDANGVISTKISAGVTYTALAKVKENLSLAGRPLSGFEGWFAKINNNFVEQTTSLNWSFSDIEVVEARFKAYQLYSVSCAVVNGSGVLEIDKTHNSPDVDDNKFIEGQDVKVIATPADGYELNYITVKKVSTGESNTVKDLEVLLSNIKSDYVIEANFSKKKCVVRYSVDDYSLKAGTISAFVEGVNEPDFEELEYGDKVFFYATPKNGYQFDGWYINGSKKNYAANFTITLTESIDVVAKFKALVTLVKSESYSATGEVSISNDLNGGFVSSGEENFVSAWITLGERCYVKAEATTGSFFGAWYRQNDAEYEDPLDLSNEDSFVVSDTTILVARFVSDKDYIYIALFNEWVDVTEKDDTVILGDLSMTGGEEISEEDYNLGLRDKGYLGARIVGARVYYRFTGSKKSTLSAVSKTGRVFDRWERKTLLNGVFDDSVIYSSDETVSINTSRNVILTAYWGTPKPVEVVLNFAKSSEWLGTLRLSGNTEDITENDTGISALIMQGEEISIAADAKNGYKFVGWFYDSNGERLLSNNQRYTFEVKYAITIYAKFEEDRNAIYRWEGSNIMKTLRWQSKVYVSTKPFDPGCARIDAVGYGVKLRVDLFSAPDIQPKNNNFKDVTILSQDCRRLPKSRPERYLQIGLQSNKEVDAVFLGTSMKEITV